MSQKRKRIDAVLIFVLLVVGACLGGISFGAPHWIGTLVFLCLGIFIFTAGIYLAILECVAKRISKNVDDRQEL